VDRLSPGSSTPTTEGTATTAAASLSTTTTDPVAEQLARAVATHENLRAIVQGITVGVSNHVRAAPGLEACHDAVYFGARDRRQAAVVLTTSAAGPTVANSRNFNTTNTNNNKSFLGIVADSPDDLLGLADPNECDAAQGVRQLKISAEYNGRGNLQSFASRTHAVWRQRHGLPPPVKTAGSSRRIPRRIRRSNNTTTSSSFAASTRSSREMEFLIYDSIAILLLILYVTFHSGHLLFPRRQEE
jgi:hypothetical protein